LLLYAHDGLGPVRVPQGELAPALFASLPPHARPLIHEHTLSELPALVHATSALTSPAPRLALLDFARCTSERTPLALLHTLADAGFTGLALVPPQLLEHVSTHAPRQGLLVRSTSTPLALAGELLRALLEREPALAALRHELSLLRRAHDRATHESEKLHEELHLAAAIQRELAAAHSLHPQGFDLGVLARPVNTVSGDVHCVRSVGPHHVAFFVADAVGHGVPAALMTMVLLTGLQAHMQLHASNLDPAHVLSSLNRELLGHGFACDRFATAVCGVLDTRTGGVRIAGAGHPPPLVISPRGTRVLETSGPLLGVFDDAPFDDITDTLAPDERLLAYSDGLEGALPRAGSSLLTQLAPLQATLLEHAASTGPRTIEAVAKLLDAQSGSLHQLDDVTVLTLALPREPIALAA
jgi:serine phosphatase RsbU (regulator of sigma subunit)